MSTARNISFIVGAAALAAATYMLFRNKQTNSSTNYMNNDKLPRGYRNNNPLNIRYSSANNWQGKILPNTDGTFEQFKSMEYGYRAALRLIQNKIRDGKDTVAELISVWAPSSENNTSGYISRVCATTGFVPGTILNESDREQLVRLVYAMAIVENGNTPLPSYDQIYAGWNLL